MKQLIALVIAAMSFVLARPGQASDEVVNAVLDRRLPEVNFVDVGLNDALGFLRDVSGLNIVPYWNAIEQAGIRRDKAVSLKIKDASIKTVLARLLEAASTQKTRLQFAIDDSVLVIQPSPDLKTPWLGVQVAAIPEKLDRRFPGISFERHSLADVMEFVRDLAGAVFTIDYKALEAAGISKDTPVTLRLRDSRLSQVLKHVFGTIANGKAKVVIKIEDRLTITAEKPAARPAHP